MAWGLSYIDVIYVHADTDQKRGYGVDIYDFIKANLLRKIPITFPRDSDHDQVRAASQTMLAHCLLNNWIPSFSGIMGNHDKTPALAVVQL